MKLQIKKINFYKQRIENALYYSLDLEVKFEEDESSQKFVVENDNKGKILSLRNVCNTRAFHIETDGYNNVWDFIDKEDAVIEVDERILVPYGELYGKYAFLASELTGDVEDRIKQTLQ